LKQVNLLRNRQRSNSQPEAFMALKQNVTTEVNRSSGGKDVVNDEQVLIGKVSLTQTKRLPRVFYPLVACLFGL